MAIAEELQIIIDAKVTQAVRDLKKVQKGMGDNEKSALTLGKAFRTLAGPLALGAVIAGAVRLGKEFSNAARDAEETRDKFNVVFSSIARAANESADELADSFGIAKSTSRELLSSTGDLLVGFGFTEEAALSLAEQTLALGSDLASLQNFAGGAKGATDALNKALVGESESVKALGIVIRQDTKEYQDLIASIQKTEQVSLIQAKALAALQIATEQSGKAIGNVALTWNSTANVQKRLTETTKALKEQLGQSINEGLTPMLIVTDSLVKSYSDWLEKSQGIINFMENFKTGADNSSASMKELENVIAAGAKAQEQLSKGFGDEFTQDLIDAGNAARILAAGVSRATAAEKEFAGANKLTQDALKAIADAEKRLIELNTIALTDLEKRQKINQDEINTWVDAKNIALAAGKSYEAIQAVIEKLVETRIALAEEDKAANEAALISAQELFGGRTEVADAWLERQRMILDQEISNQEAITAKNKEESDKRIAITQMEQEAKLSILSSGVSIATDLTGALVDANIIGAKKAFAITKALASSETVINTAAAIAEASPNPLAIAAAVALGAAQLVKINTAKAPSFATGGSFVTNKPQMIQVGEAGPEEVTVNPVSGGGSGGGSERVFASVDGGEGFWMTIQRGIDNRNLHSTAGGVI